MTKYGVTSTNFIENNLEVIQYNLDYCVNSESALKNWLYLFNDFNSCMRESQYKDYLLLFASQLKIIRFFQILQKQNTDLLNFIKTVYKL